MDIPSISRNLVSTQQNKLKIYIRNKILLSKKYTNELNRYGNTILHNAVSNPNCTLITILELLPHKVHVNAKNFVGDTPLHFAVYSNCKLDVIRLLFLKGADIHAQNNFGDTALHRALDRPVINTEIIELLLQLGADVNKSNIHNETALHYCLQKPDLKLFKLLLDHGGNCRAVNKKSGSLLHLALDTKCDIELIHLLIDSGIPINSQNYAGHTPLQIALCNKVIRLDVIKLLLNKGADCNLLDKVSYPLKNALTNSACTLDVIQMLLQYGARTNVWRPNGESVLHTACISCRHNVDIIRLLLDNDADINAINDNGESPLFWALKSLNCQFEIIKLLLERGSSLEIVNENEDSPLHIAVSGLNCNTEIIQLMLDHGVDVNKENKNGKSALCTVLGKTKVNIAIVKLLLGKVSINTYGYSCTPLHYALGDCKFLVKVLKPFLENEVNLRACDNSGAKIRSFATSLILYCATLSGNIKNVRLMLANQGLVSLQDEKGKSPLDYAVASDNEHRSNHSQELVKLLIKHSVLQENYAVVGSVKKCWDYPMMMKFYKICLEEKKQMCSEYVTQWLSLTELICGLSETLDEKWKDMNWDIKHLLWILGKKKYPVYSKVIADTIKREVMVRKLSNSLIYTKSKDTGTKSVLNYHCVNHVINYLTDGELLNMLLVFHQSCPYPNAKCGKRPKCKPNVSPKKQKLESFFCLSCPFVSV